MNEEYPQKTAPKLDTTHHAHADHISASTSDKYSLIVPRNYNYNNN